MNAIVKIFVFVSWHEIKKISRQNVIHTFLSWLIQYSKYGWVCRKNLRSGAKVTEFIYFTKPVFGSVSGFYCIMNVEKEIWEPLANSIQFNIRNWLNSIKLSCCISISDIQKRMKTKHVSLILINNTTIILSHPSKHFICWKLNNRSNKGVKYVQT